MTREEDEEKSALIFKGSVVQLNSGGPKMTVIKYYEDLSEFYGWVEVKWFAGNEPKTDRFSFEEITVIASD